MPSFVLSLTALAAGPELYAEAMTADRAQDVGTCLARLSELAASGWELGLDPADFVRSAAASPEAFGSVRSRLDALWTPVPRAREWARIPVRDLLPEGLERDPGTGELLMSSGRWRKVVRVSADGVVRDLVPSGHDGLLATLGLRVAGDDLWVASAAAPFMEDPGSVPAGTSRLHRLSLTTGAVSAKYELPPPSLANDVVVLPDGRAVVTDSIGDMVWITEGERLRPLVAPGAVTAPNGVVASADGAVLYVATWLGVVRVEVATGAASSLPLPQGTTPLAGIDGLYLHEGALLGIQNAVGRPRVVRVPLASDGRSALSVEVLDTGSPMVDNPTTGVVVGDEFVFLARRNREAGGPLEDLVIAAVPLSLEAPSARR